MRNSIKNLPESIRARLNNYARDNQRTFQSVFYLYAFECFLRRLSVSKYYDKFILKGGVVFLGWGIPMRRVTKDIDLQGYIDNSIENIIKIIKEICLQPIDDDDGMVFNADSVTGMPIMETAAYKGTRVLFIANLGASVIYMQIDVSFANIITPSPKVVEYPTILETPKFPLNCYPCETTISEKFHAITDSGLYNDRYRDFYDIWIIKEQFEIQGDALKSAIIATFDHRNTVIPANPPAALLEEFAKSKQQLWQSFLKKNVSGDIQEILAFDNVTSQIISFLLPVLQSISNKTNFNSIWIPTSGWMPRIEGS
jgi:hypothetical protein